MKKILEVGNLSKQEMCAYIAESMNKLLEKTSVTKERISLLDLSNSDLFDVYHSCRLMRGQTMKLDHKNKKVEWVNSHTGMDKEKCGETLKKIRQQLSS